MKKEKCKESPKIPKAKSPVIKKFFSDIRKIMRAADKKQPVKNQSVILDLSNCIHYTLRDFEITDSDDINRIALLAFNQYKNRYTDWPGFSTKISNMASLAENSEIIVAEINNKIVGAVAYVPPGQPKSLFPAEWPVIRMLVVDPDYRGAGIGKALTEECIQRAIRDKASLIALHTSPIMEVALRMYLKMGFVFERKAEDIHGVEYNIYVKPLP